MTLPARPSPPASRSAFRRPGAIARALPRAIRRARPGRRWGAREFVCSAFGELLGLQVGATISFYLINGELVPEASHHLAWSLSLTLGALAGGAFGWWIARVTRQEAQLVRAE